MATDAEIMPKVTTSEEELSSAVSDTASETSYKEIWKRRERIRETTPNFSMVLFILGVCLTAPTLTFCIAVEYASAKTGKTTTTDIVALAVPTVVQQIAIRWFLKYMKSVEIYRTLAMSLAGLSGIALIPQRDGSIAGVCVLGFGTFIGLKQICEQADKELKQFALFWFNNGCFIGLILGGFVHRGKILLLFPKKIFLLFPKKILLLFPALHRSTFIFFIFLKFLVFQLKRLNISTYPTMQTAVTKGVKTAPSNRLKFRLTTKLPFLNNLNTKHISPGRLFCYLQLLTKFYGSLSRL